MRRHFLRRAACRLLTSSAAAPAWSSRAVAPRALLPVASYVPSYNLSQTRWFRDEIQSRYSSRRGRRSNVPEDEDVETAIRSAGEYDQYDPSEIVSPETDDKALEQSSRARRLRLLEKSPTPKETIYIGNLFYDVTSEDLRKHMEKYGAVERTNVILDSRGMSRGFAYVQFESVEAARRAIDGTHLQTLEGRRVTSQYAQTNMDGHRSLQPVSRTLYIGNLSFEMTDRDLNDLFKDVSNVIDVRVSIDRRTGQPRGFAHAEFIDAESAQKGLEILSRKSPYGRQLRLDYSHTNRRAERIENNKPAAE
ncbi:nucleic acid-binding protein [Aspergillus clavatus NRRL 1]|uniref:RNA binding domain protein n=1 Tax=Aspergillus clavatus (strain ATCC 1007 / CBS 513.65 / DSM 816 / NCTC 3887 / NRRL 1 / QM 1276 / 107) TaxID=344612 RepID=A1C467_ASPCL|nr:RNA binding domain protein [Aspergillus clavatus NRRL 1]EAW15207.1 RNA binding domain protein [Aspergillus clavatus NRRL 1]